MGSGNRPNILSVLFSLQHAKAADARDELYAVTSLVEGGEIDIDIDYVRTVEAVYREWAKKRILWTKSLDVFGLVTDSIPECAFDTICEDRLSC